MAPSISTLMPPSTKRHQTELILGTCRVSRQNTVSRRKNGHRDRGRGVTLLQTYSEPVCRPVPGVCWIQAQSQAGSASQASSGFCSNDCLILRSFKHVKTVDSRAAYLFSDRLNYTTGIHHKHKEKGESLENQTWKISTLNHTATFSTQGSGHCSLKPLSIFSFLWVYTRDLR